MTTYIVKIKGHQHRVKKGDEIIIDKIAGKEGEKIEFEKVLLIKEGEKDIEIGKPYVKGKKVQAKILSHVKGPKIEMVKYKKKNRYLKRQGHRQQYTKIKIL